MSTHTATQDSPVLPEKPESMQSKGGKARARNLSPEQRSKSASEAAKARWLPKSKHQGNFINDFGIDVDCYVLDDKTKTAVISQRGMGRALGLPAGGTELPKFLATKAMVAHLGGELASKLSQPVNFQWVGPGGEKLIHGFDVTLLIDLCRVIIEAEKAGALGRRNSRVVRQAHVVLNASAKSGIKGLVYALAGYTPSAVEVIAAFKLYVQEEARKYEKEFPPELYAQWHRLYDIPIPDRGRPWHFKHLTVKHIYGPLARSNGKIIELLRALKADGGNRTNKLFQFLNDVGARALRMHMGRVLEMAESSTDRKAYENKIIDRFGGQGELEICLPESGLSSAE